LGLNKIGSGVQTLTGANTYFGSTTLSQGTLALGVAHSIDSSPSVVVAGGTLGTRGFSQFNGSTTLTLQSSGHVDLGLGGQPGEGTVQFGASSTTNQGITWTGTLTIDNWTPGIDHLFIGFDSAGLDPSQVGQVTFANFGAAQITSLGEL